MGFQNSLRKMKLLELDFSEFKEKLEDTRILLEKLEKSSWKGKKK